MVVRKQVEGLERLCIKASSNLIYLRCKRLADEVIKIGLELPRNQESDKLAIRTAGVELLADRLYYNEGKGHLLDSDKLVSDYSTEEIRQIMVANFVHDIRRYLWSHIPYYLYDDIVDAVLSGCIQSVEEMKKDWKLGTNMPIFTQRVYAIIKVTEAIQHKHLKNLKVDTMPKMIRANVIRNLDKFPYLKVLDLGSNTGAMMVKIQREGELIMSSAIKTMDLLVVFSLKYNCNNDILKSLLAAKSTLKVLDIEYSRVISDESVSIILEMNNIEELSICKTGLSAEGQANLILGLPHLKALPRGDFLCEALEWIAWDNMNETKPYHKLNIKNFWSSEEYYFHTFDQMTLVSEMCPYIKQMLFMFQDRYTCPLDVLSKFNYLQELELWGGDFYQDQFEVVLQAIGKNITRLELHHFDGIDLKCLSLLSLYCVNLEHLSFSGCGFKDRPETTDEFESSDRWQNKDIFETMEPYMELKTLSICSPCPSSLLQVLLQKAINIKKLTFGLDCSLTDEIMDKVFIGNKLQYLEEFEVRKSELLGMPSVSSLLLHCDNLRCILDLAAWSKITKENLDELKLHMKENNIEMKLSEELEREISLYEICQSQLKERYGPVEWFGEE